MLCALCLGALTSQAQAQPSLPAQFNAFLESPVRRPPPIADAGEIAHVEERLGVPTFFWAPGRKEVHGYRAMNLSAEEAARRYLLEYGALWRQNPKVLAETAKVARVHELDRGAVIVAFRKEVDGFRVFRDELKVIMTHDLDLVAIAGYLPPHQKIGLRGEKDASFRLSHATALGAALYDLTRIPVESPQLIERGEVIEGYHAFELAPSGKDPALRLLQPARTRQVLFTLPEGLEPAYYVELDVALTVEGEEVTRAFGYVISAQDGRVLFRNNHVHFDAYTYRVWSDPDGMPWDGPHGTTFSPHPTGVPDGTAPVPQPQNTITVEHGPISTGDPWLGPGATVTQGNNVDAYADLNSPDGFTSGDRRPAVTSAGAFEFVYDFNVDPAETPTQIDAAVTQMFVDTNFFHDWYYDIGFDEAAGNAQKDNFGRGGIGNDVFLAEGQDFSGFDNANMSVPSDGAHPRMQMYIFTGNSTQQLTLTTGEGAKQNFFTRTAAFGPQNFNVTAPAVLADDGTGTPSDACEPLVNAVTGKIVLVDRGTCTFVTKAKMVQDAGGLGIVIANNQGGGSPILSGSDPTITIPALSCSRNSGTTIKAAISAGNASLTMVRTSSPHRDGTVDNAIIAHEWGHYISNRLIGDANGLDNLQGAGMGEGWGDFHALLVIVRPEDALAPNNSQFEGVYPTATWVMTADPGNGLYYGIRRVPYSTDFSKNALTFKHIQDGVPLPSGVPTAFGSSGNQNSEVHNTGEVWATMLWECYAALLSDSERLSFEEARDRMRRYLVGGYKGTPNSPTFVEARDALLAAAFANDPADYALLADAFARRGLGQKAVAPNRGSSNNSPVVEDFTTGSSLYFVKAELNDSISSCDDDGVLDNGETGALTITVRNAGAMALTQTTATITSETPGVTIDGGGTVTFPASQPFGEATATATVHLDGATGLTTLTFQIVVTDPALSVQPAPITVAFRGNMEETFAASAVDTVEARQTMWTTGHNPQLNDTEFRRVELSPTEHVWFGPNPDSPADSWLVSPSMDVSPTEDLVITFRHRYDFEADEDNFYDGGVLELRANLTGPWIDIGGDAVPGYDGTLAPSPSSNPLRGREAWVGQSPGYPEFVTTTVNLGKAYAGQIIELRFRIGADDAAAHKGWEIDDIALQGIVGTPFPLVTAQKKVCGNHTPVANAGGAKVVTEGQTVTLTATGTDEDGDPLTFAWTQTEGAAVSLEKVDAATVRFVAPDVDQSTELQFQVVANDGKEDSAPASVKVTVNDAGAPPVAVAEFHGELRPGAVISLDGSKSHDPEGATLTYRWTRLDGDAATPLPPDNDSGSHATFVIPERPAQATYVIELVVSDGKNESAPARLELKVGGLLSGCGCAAGESPGAAPLWLGLIAAAAVLGRRRGRA